MTFEECVNLILEFEGGYVAHPSDPGGATKFGISQRSYPTLDILNLTKEDAIKIYKEDYWDKLRLSEFPPIMRLQLFDSSVNQGRGFAVRTLQRILNVNVDGFVGDLTIRAVFGRIDIEEVYMKFVRARLDQYYKSTLWDTFGRGWVKRLVESLIHYHR